MPYSYAPQAMQQGRPGTSDPAFQRRQLLARQLMAQQAQPAPSYSWGETLARALTPMVTAWGAKDEENTAKARDEAFQKDYGDVVKQWQAGGSTQALAALLAGNTNKDVAALAPGQVIEDAKMQREQTLRQEDRAWRQSEADKDRAIAAQRHAESLALQRQAAARAGAGTYGQPMEVMGPDGKPMLVRFNSRGGYEPVQGVQPLPGAPAQEKPIFQDQPIDGDRVQKVVSYDGGRTFQNFGAPYNRREPFIVQEQVNPQTGEMERVAIPREMVANAMTNRAQPQAAPAPAADPGGVVIHPQAQQQPQAPAPAARADGAVSLGPSGKPAFNEAQGKAAGFADRMANSHGILSNLEGSGTSATQSVLSQVPGVGNYLISGDRQKYEQAQRDFINAVLRRESGAVISDEEFANARKQYFPQPGDSADVLKQKALNRQIVIDSFRRDAGPAYRPRQEAPKRYKFNPATGELE